MIVLSEEIVKKFICKTKQKKNLKNLSKKKNLKKNQLIGL